MRLSEDNYICVNILSWNRKGWFIKELKPEFPDRKILK